MDNKYWRYGCPGLMSDARFTTQYIDSDVLNQKIRHLNNIQTSHEFRTFLQKNASTIMDNERKFLQKEYMCGVHGKCVSDVPSNKKDEVTQPEQKEEKCSSCDCA